MCVKQHGLWKACCSLLFDGSILFPSGAKPSWGCGRTNRSGGDIELSGKTNSNKDQQEQDTVYFHKWLE